jgi:hypothetical protein
MNTGSREELRTAEASLECQANKPMFPAANPVRVHWCSFVVSTEFILPLEYFHFSRTFYPAW